MNFGPKYFYKNIIFTERQAFAVYNLPHLPFNFLKDEQRKDVLRRFEEFLQGYYGHGQILYLVNSEQFEEGRYLSKAGIGNSQAPVILHEAHRHAVETQAYFSQINAWKRVTYLVLELPLIGWGKTALKTTLNELKETIIETVLSFNRQHITPKLIREAESLERELHYQHSKTLWLTRAQHSDMDYMIRRNLHRGSEIPPALTPRVEGKIDRSMLLSLGDGVIFEEETNCMKFISPEGQEHWQAFMTLVDVPKEIPELGFEWLSSLNFLDYPVDAAINFKSIPSFEAARKLKTRKGMLKDQMREYERGGDETTIDMDWANDESKVLESKLNSGMSQCQVGCTFSVWAPDREQLQSAAKTVTQHFQSIDLRIVRAPGDQMKMFYSFIPSSAPSTGAMIECDPGYIAASGIQAGFEIGDCYGFSLGHILNGIPVYWNPGDAMQRDFPGTTIITGVLGTGKSVLKKYLIYLAALKGARIFLIDPKNEDFIFKKLPFTTRQIDMSYSGGAKANPLKISPDRMRAMDISRDYLGIVLNVGENEARKLVISEALDNVFNLPEPQQNLFALKDFLANYNDRDTEKTNEALRCARLLEAYKKSRLGQMVFTNESISTGTEQITICNVSELPLPKKESNLLTESERQGVGLLYLTAAYSREVMFRSKQHALKLFSLDEGWTLLDIPEGERLVDELVRMSRSFGIVPLLVTQNCSDVRKTSIRNNIGYVYCFRARDANEIQGNAELLQVDGQTDEIVHTFRNMETGCCMMRDPEGRVGVVNIVPKPDYLLPLFSTRPSKRDGEVENDR